MTKNLAGTGGRAV